MYVDVHVEWSSQKHIFLECHLSQDLVFIRYFDVSEVLLSYSEVPSQILKLSGFAITDISVAGVFYVSRDIRFGQAFIL